MSLIVAAANQKGGVGKSTCTLLAATALSLPPFNYRVEALDIDPQRSLYGRREYDLDETEGAPPYPIHALSFGEFAERVEELDRRAQILFLDVPGKLDSEAGRDSEAIRALQYVDVVLVPVTAGNFALAATVDYIKAVLAVQRKRPELRLITFHNMHRSRSRHGRALSEELDELANLTGAVLMKTPLKRYSAYEDADTLTSLYGTTGSAGENFTAWIDELHDHLLKN